MRYKNLSGVTVILTKLAGIVFLPPSLSISEMVNGLSVTGF